MHIKEKQNKIERLKEVGVFNEKYIKEAHKGIGPRFYRKFK